jgi:hypothetical protein
MNRYQYCAGLASAVLFSGTLMAAPAPAGDESKPLLGCTFAQIKKIKQGFDIAPVALNLEGKNSRLVGLGSYIVNAQGGCNDCHTNPPYAPGGDPFKGEPEQINVEGYLAGGQEFGPFISRNLTPCENGEPEWTFKEFLQILRTGVDLEDDEHSPGNTPLLQVMPWPVYSKMTTCDLRAVYEYLRAIPPRRCEASHP